MITRRRFNLNSSNWPPPSSPARPLRPSSWNATPRSQPTPASTARSRNSPGSVNEIDFSTALGRLLRDAALREQFARDPALVAALLQVRDGERAEFAALSPEEIEVQATILLRKRFDAVRRLIPVTMERL